MEDTVMEDRINQLPDLILSCIISNLTLKDVIKTSALSKRWKKLHRELIHKLNFDMPNLLESKYDKHKFNLDDNEFFLGVRYEFMNRISQVLRHFKGSKISCFKVCFYLDSEESLCVDRWISSAIAFGVEEIQLLFSSKPFFLIMREEGRLYEFPHSLFTQPFLKHLYLQNCILRPSSDFIGFTKLITLRLEDVTLGQDFSASLFNICIHLQELILISCYFSPSSILRVVSTSLHKLSLHLWTVLKVEISAVNLISFEYKTNMPDITLFHAPRLAKFYFCTERLTQLLSQLSQLRSVSNLEILSCILYTDQAKELASAGKSAFINLKQLRIFYYGDDEETGQDLTWLLDILKASPLLQKFHLTKFQGILTKTQKRMEKLCGWTHRNLKQVEIGGCSGNWHEIELMLFIFKKAIALQRVIIQSSKKIDLGDGNWIYFEPKSSWLESDRDIFQRSLQNNIPENVQLIIY